MKLKENKRSKVIRRGNIYLDRIFIIHIMKKVLVNITSK